MNSTLIANYGNYPSMPLLALKAFKALLPLLLILWPHFKDLMARIIAKSLEKNTERFKRWLDSRIEKWLEKAEEKEQQAKGDLNSAHLERERVRAEERAELWKEIAEHLRKENSDLKDQVKKLSSTESK